MYLLFFILCDITVILATENTQYFYKLQRVDRSDALDLQLLPQERLKRDVGPSAHRNESSASSTVVQNPEIVPLENATKTNDSISGNTTQIQSGSKKTLNYWHASSTELSSHVTTPGKNSSIKNETEVITHHISNDNFSQPLPMDINNDTLKLHNISTKYEDFHVYYNSSRTEDVATGQHYWVDMTNSPNVTTHQMLSSSHRRAVTVPLPFKFQFYGHEIDNVTIATGGFLYTGDYIHSWLAATQYIAPLMANFDTGISNDSFIRYFSNSTTFTVLWENVLLQDRPQAGNFTFEVTLCKNGDIIFVYKNIPNITNEITEDYHPVKIGVSDAYILDRNIFFVRRKTIFEYHRVHFDKRDLKNWTVIYFKPLPSCLSKTTCESCLAKDTTFECLWCDGRCSTGIDRKRHDWVKKDCDRRKVNDMKNCRLNERASMATAHKAEYSGAVPATSKSSSGVTFFVVVTLGGVFILFIWTLYAYRNPHTASGQMLIRYRPSQWSSWRKGEARYTAATIHM